MEIDLNLYKGECVTSCGSSYNLNVQLAGVDVSELLGQVDTDDIISHLESDGYTVEKEEN
jgi:hypothetical protein